jgi:colanic acid biosynthesis glycosyl transferase WcaI
MRILIVSQYFWPENFRINDLAAELCKRGHSVSVLTGMPNYPSGQFEAGYGITGPYREFHEGVEILRCPLVRRGRGGRLRLVLNYLSFAVAATLRVLWCGRRDYDVIFVHEPSPLTVALPAIALKLVTPVPVMLWVLDLWPESVSATEAIRSPWILRWIERMVRMIYRHCDRILVQSRAFIAHVERQHVPSDKILYFPSWAEALYETSCDGLPLPEGVRLPEGFRVMFAGNVGAAQDFGTILTAAERLKAREDIQWIILGDGRMMRWVEQEVTRRQLNRTVHLLGRHTLGSMPAFYAQADAMLVTLRQEPIFALTIPGKVQSYMAAGRPILAALDGEGARIIHEAGAGYVVPSESPEALADAVVKLANTPRDSREQMGRRAAAYYAAHFERSMLFDRLERWMRELSADAGPSRLVSQRSLVSERGKHP